MYRQAAGLHIHWPANFMPTSYTHTQIWNHTLETILISGNAMKPRGKFHSEKLTMLIFFKWGHLNLVGHQLSCTYNCCPAVRSCPVICLFQEWKAATASVRKLMVFFKAAGLNSSGMLALFNLEHYKLLLWNRVTHFKPSIRQSEKIICTSIFIADTWSNAVSCYSN